MKNRLANSIAHNMIKMVIATFVVIVVTPIALLFASMKSIMTYYLKSKTVVALYVARVKKRMAND